MSNVAHGFDGQKERAKIVTELSKRMGLDGFAMCGATEDLTFIDELNIDESAYRLPWFDQMRGSELQQLFGEKKHRVFNKKPKHRFSLIDSEEDNLSRNSMETNPKKMDAHPKKIMLSNNKTEKDKQQ